MTIGTRKHRFDGLGAGVAKEVFQLRAHLATGRRVAEGESRDRDGDDHQRTERKHRVIGKGRTEQRGLVARKSRCRLAQERPHGHCGFTAALSGDAPER